MRGKQTRAKERRLCAQIEKWRERLQLQDWELGWEAVDEIGDGLGADLQTGISRYRRATVRVSDWRTLRGMDFHVRHEMLHLALHAYRERAMALAELLGPEACEREKALLIEIEDQVVTRLQRAFDQLDRIEEPNGDHYI